MQGFELVDRFTSDFRASRLNSAAVYFQGDRKSSVFFCRIKRLEILSVRSMDPRNQAPVEKHPGTEVVSAILCSLSLGELGNSSAVRQGDLGKVEAGKVEEFDKRPDVGKVHKEVGKVEAAQGEVGKLNATGPDSQAANQLGKLVPGKVGKIEEIGKISNQEVKVETEGVGKSRRQHNLGKIERGRDVCSSQGKVGQVDSTNAAKIFTTLERGQQVEDNAPGKLDLNGDAEAGALKLRIRGKIEEIVERSNSELLGKQNVGKSGTGKSGAEMSAAGGAFHEGVAGKNEQDSGMVKCVIFLAAKSPSHGDLIHALTSNRELKLPMGAEVLPLRLSESKDAKLRELFHTSHYLLNLRASQFGAFVLYSPVIPSTHTLLSQNFHAFPQGSICIAGAQSQGKGRAGNVWESPEGCLMFSFTIKMTNGRLLPFLQYVVSLAVIEGLEETCKVKGTPAPEVRIKWPNDLYAKGLKIGGVLCTSTYSAKTFNIVVGVGLNVGNRKPTTCLDALIQELDPRAVNLRQEELLASIMSRFEELNETFCTDGFSPLQESYYNRWLHSEQIVTLEEKDPKSSKVAYVPVTIRGLTPTGYLLATDEQGEEYELHPDGNSFDFLKGLKHKSVLLVQCVSRRIFLFRGMNKSFMRAGEEK
ncbi:hypothetical protein R1flu_005481 [Riccia fluitans]|uniref:BPL/LPL catalytic domain-containing protein n=1 Tax=Riccia fluitans TaxID=41844 RepID=A0ABD1YW93_9MARC